MNARTIALFASMAFVAVMVGLFGARACGSSKSVAAGGAGAGGADVATPSGGPALDAPPQIDPHAPLVAPIASGVVDAGEAMPLVAIAAGDDVKPRVRQAKPSRGRDDDGDGDGDDDHDDDDDDGKRDAPPSRPAPAPAPAIVDAGVVAALVDAGADGANVVNDARVERSADAMPSAPLKVIYRDELSWLKLVELRVFLNGKRVVEEKPTDRNRPPRGERTLLDTRLFPGHHQVRVETVYVGESSGIFDYMDSVKVRMREMTVIEVDETHGARVLAHAFDRGALEPWEKRPGLKLSTTK